MRHGHLVNPSRLTLVTLFLLAVAACKFDELPPLEPVTDAPASLAVGGLIAGLWTGAPLELRLTSTGGADQMLTVNEEGSFAFPTAVATGASFAVTVGSQPAEHACEVQNGSGDVGLANHDGVRVVCTSTFVIDVALLGPDPFTFDKQVSRQADLPVSIVETQTRVLVSGPAGSTAALNGAAQALEVASAPIPLAFGDNAITVDFTIGTLSRRYTMTVQRGASGVVQSGYIKAANRDADDFFGFAVAGEADRIAVSATDEDSGGTNPDDDSVQSAGAVYIFKRSGASWAQEAYLKGTNPGVFRGLGFRLDLQGETLVAGSYASANAAWVFRRYGLSWIEEQRIAAPDAGSFGSAVAVDGDLVAIGAPAEAESPTTANGAVYVFRRSGTSWSLEATIRAPNRDSSDRFGSAVALDGDVLVISAMGEDGSGTGTTSSPSVENGTTDSGAIYVYRREGTSWAFEAYLKSENTGASDGFGDNIYYDDGVLVVGVPSEDSGSQASSDNSVPEAGAVYVFRRSGTSWTQEAYLKTPVAVMNGKFGQDVAIRGDTIAASEARELTGQARIHLFRRDSGNWAYVAAVTQQPADAGEGFGWRLALTGEGLIGTAPAEAGALGPGDSDLPHSGAAFSFR